MKRQSRPRALSEAVEKLIAQRSLESKKRRIELADDLAAEIQAMGERPPTPETLVKRISKARNHQSKLDGPWHLGVLRDYPYFHPEAVAKIFELKSQGLEHLSIRTALWISRLVSLPMSTGFLYMTAFEYSMGEQVSDISGFPKHDTTQDDADLVKELQSPDATRDLGRWDDSKKDGKR